MMAMTKLVTCPFTCNLSKVATVETEFLAPSAATATQGHDYDYDDSDDNDEDYNSTSPSPAGAEAGGGAVSAELLMKKVCRYFFGGCWCVCVVVVGACVVVVGASVAVAFVDCCR